MNIRAKLTALFFSIVVVIMTALSLAIYYFSENYRQEDFYRRLKNRATNTAKVLFQIKEVNAELLKRMEKNNPASLPDQFILIYNTQLEELYRSDGTNILNIDNDFLKVTLAKEQVHFTQGEFEALAFVLHDRSELFIIIAYAQDVYGKDAIRNLRYILFLTFAASLVLISFLGWIYAGRVLQPISKIVDEVSKISETNLNRRVEEGNKNDELGRLAQTFNKMLDRLEDAFTAQKHFISNASHEIKTPITVMRGQIDVALLQDRDRPYYISVLESLAKILKGLNKLSSRLLMLAQSTASITDRVFSPIRIDDVIWETKVELLNAHGEYNVDVVLDKELADKPLTIAGDEQLLKVAILNLLDNGCKYSPNHTVCVSLSYEADNYLSLSFVNTGLPISTGDLQRIFEPFFRSAGNSSSKGFGIGLSLTASIVKLHGGVISVSSTQDSTEFVVKLPAK